MGELPDDTDCTDTECETPMVGATTNATDGRFVKRVKVRIQPEPGLRGVSFVLRSGELQFRPKACQEFFVPVPSGVLQGLMEQAQANERVSSTQVLQLGRGGEAGSLLCIVGKEISPGGASGSGPKVRPVEIFSDCLNHLVLHWGMQQNDRGSHSEDGATSEALGSGEWISPEPGDVPAGTRFEQGACETPFQRSPAVVLGGDDMASEWRGMLKNEPKEGLARLQCVSLKVPSRYDAVAFVVRTASWGEFGPAHVGECVESGEEVWFRDHWRDFKIPISPESDLGDGIEA